MNIPIKKSSSGNVVAEVSFVGGGPLTATGKIDKLNNGTNTDIKIIRDAILKYKSFSGELVYTPSGHVAIWRGFWGWMGGLRLILPTVGYEMITGDIDWP